MEYTLFVLLILSKMIMSFGLKVNVVHKWKYCEYEWESEQQKEDAINSGNYNMYSCKLFDADKAKDGRIFVTAIREMGPGAPATVATVTNKTGPGGPLLRPYPDWSWHNSSCICSGIVNVYRVHIQCNYIFVLDTGKIGLDQICNPKLLIFDLKDDSLVKTIYIPLDLATNQTGFGILATPMIYVPKQCKRLLDEMIVFIADSLGSGLIVYDSSTKRMCRIESHYMIPTDTIFSIAGENFTYVGGIFSLTTFYNDLYYAPIAAKEIYKIKIKSLLECPNEKTSDKQTKLVKKFSSQIVPLTTVGDAIFYSSIKDMSLLGTNIYKKSDKNTVVLVQDSEKLQAISGLKYSIHSDQLTFLSNRYQRFFLGTVNLNETNFRYMEIELADIRNETDLFSRTKITKS